MIVQESVTLMQDEGRHVLAYWAVMTVFVETLTQ